MRWRREPALLALGFAGLLLLALTAFGVALQPPTGTTRLVTPGEVGAFVAAAGAAGLVYLAAVGIVLRWRLPASALWLVLAVAVLMRLLLLPTQPFLSTDVYRYVWDGKVQAAGINPYLFKPADPALTLLRDDAIYPNINRAATAVTIYPPVAQWIFAAAAWLSATVTGMKLVMLGFEAVTVAALIHLLGRAGLPRERVLIYAWHPLGIWEFAGNGHVDAAAIGLVMLAWLAREHGRAALVGLALGAATLVKFLPVCFLPALWRRPDLRLPLVFAAFLAVAYLPYLGAGLGVLGYLPGYAEEEKLQAGPGFYPLFVLEQLAGRLPGLAVPAYLAMAVSALFGLALWMMFGRPAADRPSAAIGRDLLVLGTAVTVALTPHHAWYFAMLIPFLCIVPSPAVLYLTVASIGLNAQGLDPAELGQALMYGPFLLLLLIELRRRRSGAAPLPAAASRRDHVGQSSCA